MNPNLHKLAGMIEASLSILEERYAYHTREARRLEMAIQSHKGELQLLKEDWASIPAETLQRLDKLMALPEHMQSGKWEVETR